MKKAVIIFNGLKFPHYLADYALSRAKKESTSLLALFLAGRETEEGYIFPSDLDAAQDLADKEDAEQDDLRVIRSQMRLLEDMAKSEGVVCKTELMVDPTLEQVLSKAQDVQLIFIDSNYKDTGLMSATNFDMQELLDRLPSGVEKVSPEKRE